ncbi:MAG TPA: potassium channel protein [Polyangiaceae bacterium]|jgi:voltage-gated potassium channel
MTNKAVKRLAFAALLLVALVLGGGVGYWALGGGLWTFSDAVYMTVVTISTVGFDELPGMASVHGARVLTVGLIIGGIGTLAYVQANVTALLVEGAIGQAWRRNRMRNKIEALSGHVVVAGSGSTGRHVIEELVATRTPFVVIDRNHEHVQRMSELMMKGEMLYVHGDATEDQVLLLAGVDRAAGVVAALTHDKDNLFVTLSARSLNATARIVSKVTEDESAPKMVKAGASSIVSPAQIGGRRMASELIRPEVNEFLDQMLRDKDKSLRLEEVVVPKGSPYVGHALRDAPIRRETNLLVIAVRQPTREFVYNPEPDFVLAEGMTLVVMGPTDGVKKLRALVATPVS